MGRIVGNVGSAVEVFEGQIVVDRVGRIVGFFVE